MAKRAKRATAFHEAGHTVASHYCRLAGATSRVTLDADDLAKHNAKRHAINAAVIVFLTQFAGVPCAAWTNIPRS